MRKSRTFKIRQQLRERIPFTLGLLGVLAFILSLCYVLGYVNQMDTIYKYTYLEPINQTGSLTSNRLDPTWWTEFLASFLRWLFVFMTIMRVAMYREPWVINMHIFITALFLANEVAGAWLYGFEYECCNNAPWDGDCNGENNICNDYRWCCVYGHVSDTCANYLQPAFNCTPNVTSADLSPNMEFAISFSLTLGHGLFGILALCLSYAARKTLLVKRQYVGGYGPSGSTVDDRFFGIGGKQNQALDGVGSESDDDDNINNADYDVGYDSDYEIGGREGRVVERTIGCPVNVNDNEGDYIILENWDDLKIP